MRTRPSRTTGIAARAAGLGAALVGAALVAAPAPAVHAATVYDEAVQGDLNDSTGEGSVPTPIGAFGLGSNVVLGTMGDDGFNNDDDDLFTFSVPSGLEIVSIALTYAVVSGGNGEGSYFGIQGGTTIATTFDMVDQNLSNALVGASGDLLALWEAGPAYGEGTGLSGPLGAGDYSIFLSEITAEIDYGIDFGVQVVPEPGTAALLGAGLLLLGARRWA